MKRFMYVLFIIFVFIVMGCENPEPVVVDGQTVDEITVDDIKLELKEEIKQEVIEELTEEQTEEPEITIDNYDYKTDPDAVVVKINKDNLSDYVTLNVYERTYADEEESKTFYCVQTHSKMYDDGYVCVGYEDAFVIFDKGVYYDEFLGQLMYPNEYASSSACPFGVEVCWKLNSKETAEKFAAEGISFFEPRFESENATLYFQKLEDVKFGYEVVDHKRIINGKEEFILNPDNLY